MNYVENINNQYGQSNLGEKIVRTLQERGINNESEIRKQLALIEDIHIRGRLATLELARIAHVKEDMKILDVGCGIGGPARVLAAKFGCNVTGIDLCKEYCEAAIILNKLTGLGNKIEIIECNVLEMHFEENNFDMIFIQHVLMNIKEKRQLLSKIYKILSPNGKLAVYEICAGNNSPIIFPVVWANDSSISFTIKPDELYQIIKSLGFKEHFWEDDTDKIIEGHNQRRSTRQAKNPPLLSYGLIIPNYLKKGRNIISNLKEGRIRVYKGIFEK
ncbi:MAG: class I SAM-dependent methyltransferase [Promethearchaeota archaeon]|jgi:2-polyprenyl-3-methyl-5-hydroxy-6-metoxy-1,4-benzoquinol methylase